MALHNVQKQLNAPLSDLQSEAWTRGVKLVTDVSTEIDVELSTGLVGSLGEVVRALINIVGPGSSLSFVTDYEPPGTGEPNGRLKLQLSAPAMGDAPLSLFVEDLRHACQQRGKVDIHTTPESWTLVLTVAGAQLSSRLPQSHLTAVVVDDDVDTQEFLSEVLKSRGFHVITVNDGFDALVVIERHNPDVVLTDILMPNMSGLDLVARIKSFRADLPVVVFSGYRDALVKNFAGLPDKILPKPMSKNEVLAAIDAVLSR